MGLCVRAQSCQTFCTRAVLDGCLCVCARVLGHVQLFALEHWRMGVCVCVCTCSVMSDFLHRSSGRWLCVCACAQSFLTLCTGAVRMGVCVCLYAQSCLTRCAEAVAYGSVRVCVFAWLCMTLNQSSGMWVCGCCMYVCVCVCVCVWHMCTQSCLALGTGAVADGCMCLCLCVLSRV